MRRISVTLLCLLLTGLLNAQQEPVADTAKRYPNAEHEALYPGGEKAWKKFLEKKLDPNVPVENGAPNGRYLVCVQFVVDKEGRITDIQPVSKEGYGMEEEVARAIGLSGAWNAGTINGRPVKSYKKQYFTFVTYAFNVEVTTDTPYVLFANRENEIKIKAGGVRDENINVEISEGSITSKGDGKYVVRIADPKRVVITVFHKKKNHKKLGAVSLEVKAVPEKPGG